MTDPWTRIHRVLFIALLAVFAWSSRPSTSSGQADRRTAPVPSVNLNLQWNEASKKLSIDFTAHYCVTSFDDLKERLRMIAGEKINPDNKFSEIPVTIVCDRDTPFRGVQKVMEICSATDVRIYKIKLRAAEGKPSAEVPGVARSGSPGTTQEKKLKPFVIRMVQQDGKSVCWTQGWPLGELSTVRRVLALQLEHAAALRMPVAIESGARVPKEHVDEVVAACRKARVSDITWQGRRVPDPQEE